MKAGGKSPWQQTLRSVALFFKLQQTEVQSCLSLFSVQCGRQWLQEMTLLRWGTQALESLCHQMAHVIGTHWLLPCYMHVIVFMLQVRVCVRGNVSKRNTFVVTVWGTMLCVCVSMGRFMLVMNPITHTHPLMCPWWQAWSWVSDCRWRWSFWCSSCTQTPPGPCTACGSSSRSLSKAKRMQTACQNRN